MKDMIKSWACMHCDEEINSESHVVFCNEACLREYIDDQKDLEGFLVKNLEREMD
jgi:predicted TIM-barrel fold metal-dependent hydrolase